MASALWFVALGLAVLLLCLCAYHVGRHRGLLRARAIVHATGTHPPALGPMPPDRAWVACCERLQRLFDEVPP